jgi:hypothetical protein
MLSKLSNNTKALGLVPACILVYKQQIVIGG